MRARIAATAATMTGLALAVAAVPGPALAQEQADDATTAQVIVQEVINITVDESFTMSGIPGSPTATDTPVSLTVTTNNPAGYTISVQPVAATLVPPDPVANTDTIDFTDIRVEDIDTPDAFTPLDPANPITVHTQASASDPTGDDHQHNFDMEAVPFIQPDTYSGDITYLAVANQ